MTGGKQEKVVNTDSVGEPNRPTAAENAPSAVHRLHADRLQCAAFLAKSLADGNRLKILLLLGEGRKSVSGIVEALDLSQPLVSHHLKELRRSLLVRVQREGPFVYHELSDHRIIEILQDLCEMSADLLSGRETF